MTSSDPLESTKKLKQLEQWLRERRNMFHRAATATSRTRSYWLAAEYHYRECEIETILAQLSGKRVT